MSLDRASIVQAALDLLDEVGVEGLTTRKLASALGIRGPSLYWHFKNKRELLDHMAESLFAAALPPAPAPEAPFDYIVWLGDGARGIRRVALSRRDGAVVMARAKPTGAHPYLSFDALVAALGRAGMTPIQAQTVLQVLGRFAAGWVLYEQAAESAMAVDSEKAFEFGLEALLRGIEDSYGPGSITLNVKSHATAF